jgi:hypothetical protein
MSEYWPVSWLLGRLTNNYSFPSCVNASCQALLISPSARRLLMDNVAFRHSKDVVALLREHDLPPPIFNPPYHPDTNPAEMAFSMMKRRARLVQPTSLQQVEQVVRDSIAQDLHPEFLRRVFEHALPFAGV